MVERGLDSSMVKKRSPISNGQAKGSGQTPTKTAKTKHLELTKSKNVKHKSNNAKMWGIISSLILLLLSVIIFEYRDVISSIYEPDDLNVSEDGAPIQHLTDGGWRLPDDVTKSLYDTTICTIDRLHVNEITQSDFEKNYRFKKPLIVKFKHGAKDWTLPTKWTVASLSREYGDWSVMSGNAREIVRRGGSGYVGSSFSKYVNEMIRSNDSLGEPFSRSGVSFHKHADAWNGVVYGRKRWFLYPVQHTPPGGVYPGYTQTEWFDQIYPGLTGNDKPMECIQEPGEIFYLPEGTYHGTINLGDTIAIGIQKKQAQTEEEKLFYEEHKLVGQIRTEANVQKKNKLMKRKKEIYISLLKLLPDNAEVHMRAGQLYKELGDLNKAVSYTEKAIQLDPRFIVAVISLGELQAQLQRPKEAEKMFQQAIKMNPKLWDCYARYGDFLLNNNRAHEAVHILQQGTILMPEMLPFWSRLKLAQERSGDVEGAKETEKKISKLQGQ